MDRRAGPPSRADHLLDQLPVGVFRARVSGDDHVDVEFASRRALEIVGSPGDVDADLWHWFVAAFPEERVAELAEAFRCSSQSGRPLHWQVGTAADPTRWIRPTANFSRPGGGDVIVEGILEDVSEAKALQDRVADEMAERTRLAERLAHVDASRASLLTAVVHDLRTPLSTITTAATLVEDPALPAGERHQLLDDIGAAAGTLSRLLDNLLDAERLRAGAAVAHLRPTDLSEALDCGRGLDWSSVAIDVPADLPRVDADPGLLERVLCNLLHNAVVYSPPGSRVVLSARREADSVLIQVVDHGPGIPPDRFADMFKPFERFAETDMAGLGLGLPIALGLTEAMGGRLTPSATEGGGLTMTVALRVHHDPPAHR